MKILMSYGRINFRYLEERFLVDSIIKSYLRLNLSHLEAAVSRHAIFKIKLKWFMVDVIVN